MTRILLVRHGQTTWNLEARYQGQRESELSALGREQGAAVARALAGDAVDAVFASPLRRSRETAEEIAAPRHLPLLILPDLVEIAHGPFDGMLVAEIARRYPREWAAWRADPGALNLAGSEPLAAAKGRALRALGEIVRRHPGGTAVAVSHGGLIKAALLALLDAPSRSYWSLRLDNGGLTVLEFDGNTARVACVNETRHLRALAGPTVEE